MEKIRGERRKAKNNRNKYTGTGNDSMSFSSGGDRYGGFGSDSLGYGGGGGSSSLYDVLELVLDRGLVIDAFVRVSLVGIEILKIDIRVVVASVDTYLRFAEACNRLDLEAGPRKAPGLPDLSAVADADLGDRRLDLPVLAELMRLAGSTGDVDRALQQAVAVLRDASATELVAAFRATLEEVQSADLILHIRDRSHPDSEAQAADVATVLKSLGLDEPDSPPRLEVWNKIDRMDGHERDEMLGEAARNPDVIAVSALTCADVPPHAVDGKFLRGRP